MSHWSLPKRCFIETSPANQLRVTTENPLKWVQTGKALDEQGKTGIINRCGHEFSPLSVDLIHQQAIHSRVVLVVVKRFGTTPFYALTLYDIATPIPDTVMPTYRITSSPCRIFMPLLYGLMPTYRIISSLCHISVPLLYGSMPTYRIISSLCRIPMPLLYGSMPTYSIISPLCPVVGLSTESKNI